MDTATVLSLLDASVTVSFLGAGAVSARARSGQRMGALLAWVGLCWWLGPVVAAPLVWWGALLHASVAVPKGRVGSPVRVFAVLVGYAAAISAMWIPVPAAGVIVIIALGLAARARGPKRWLPLCVAAVLGANAVAHLVTPARTDPTTLAVMEVALCLFAAVFLLLLEKVGAEPDMVDLIVRFGPDNARQILERLERLGSTDEAIRQASTAAARLVDANGALSHALRGRIVELEASRERLVAVEDRERASLETRLQRGPIAGLDNVWARMATIDSQRPGVRERLDKSRALVVNAREDLLRISGGLYPAAVADGRLESALDAVTRDCSLPVEVDLRVERLPMDVAACVYYVCAESVANVMKHAQATRIWVAVAMDGEAVAVEIRDDGVGGADPSLGTGLLGLIDRVEVLGGTCSVSSHPGRGTTVSARIPSDAQLI